MHLCVGADRPRWVELPAGDAALAPLQNVTRSLMLHNPIVHSTIMARRQALLAVGGYDETRVSQLDYDLYVRLVADGARIGKLPVPLGVARIHGAQRYEARSRIRYMLRSTSVQARAVRTLRGPPVHYAPIPARFAYCLLPRRLRGLVRRVGRAHSYG